ncbi:MAG: flagellar basal body P-ring protein FlgI [Nevskiaceae bacterium]|nr:MAG: flagellar basal body P-ring protein FlgI [Nevskiaceae bacterium]TBR71561.1 MAG: flagellar basal body P-ring protein FlgI [Nevskiaceae bacterium]
MKTARTALVTALLVVLGVTAPAHAERVQDLADIAGVRTNALIGYGIVAGLDGTGDQTSQTPFTIQSLRNTLFNLGVTIPPNVNPQLKNVAAVALRATLPPFAQPGQNIDVTVSSIGTAASLKGGTLMMAPLKGADGQVYAIAQGTVVVGGFGATGKDGSKISVNVPSSGSIPNGATVERALPNAFDQGSTVTFNLRQADFTTAMRLSNAINAASGSNIAQAMDAVSVRVQAPPDAGSRVAFLARIQQLDVQPGVAPARVVVNARTGTIVIGQDVTVSAAAVAHGSLTVSISERTGVSQPAPFSNGQTVAVPQSTITAQQEKAHMFMMPDTVSLQKLVDAVNQIGATPGDLVAILEALKTAGALHADLVVE